MMGLLLRLYPRAWRARYGDEFAALLEERPFGPYDAADVLFGAIDAHLHLRRAGARSQRREGITMSLRIGGIAAVVGGILWAAGIAWALFDPADSDPSLAVIFAAIVALLVGLVGLSAFQAREHPRLIWAAFALPALGAVVSIVGLTAMAVAPDGNAIDEIGWAAWLLGLLATFVGSSLFAIATYRARVLSRTAAAILGIAAPFAFVGLLGLSALPNPLPVVAAVPFSLGWMALGWSGLRLGRPPAAMAA